MNSEDIPSNDTKQLQQTIIYLRAELAKSTERLKKYDEAPDYVLIEKLEQEVFQLSNEKNDLSNELYKLQEEMEKQSLNHKDRINLYEMQRKTAMTTINHLEKTATDLRQMNKQLTEVIKVLKDGFTTDKYRTQKYDKQVTSLHQKIAEYKATIEQLEYKLVQLLEEANKQISSKIEKLDITFHDYTQSQNEKQQLINEIEQKNVTIENLQQELLNVKELNQKQGFQAVTEEHFLSVKAPESFVQLEHQINEVIGKSLDSEEKLDAKLNIINDLEHKLNQLATEIDNRTNPQL
ncbi:hypothetical protein [Psychrobacillus lasiicapitis]|uniref:Uncharacterized protein n=1 Tax=Psychrobacillus lasiicapitis TaxID=1636719 RepID=A0A544T4U5_9BACI|nr:hypothetical protein [Psychrobacillus lasiicapitis]TQR12467.1 hypothetical protein FG382_12630 [Psychrobacillus lasiicapitis]GGA38341.1 hypothetical protein GCM10011384_29860 [Psychrobacillus lasiicapitis]